MALLKSELEAFLEKPRLAHLSTANLKGKPRVTPMWFKYEQGTFYFTTRLNRLKAKHYKQNPFMAVSIATEEQPYVAVCAFGKSEIIKENREGWLKRIAYRYGEKEGKAWLESLLKQLDRIVLALRQE